MDPNLSLNAATPADIPAIRDLAQRIWWAHYPDIIGPEQVDYMLQLNYSAEALERQMADGQTFWLVDNEGVTAGFLSISQKEGGRFFLHKFYLDNTQRGRGLGAAVFHLLLKKHPELRELRLTVNRQNFKSINFYFKIGFVIEQCVDIEIGAGFVMNDFQMLWRKAVS